MLSRTTAASTTLRRKSYPNMHDYTTGRLLTGLSICRCDTNYPTTIGRATNILGYSYWKRQYPYPSTNKRPSPRPPHRSNVHDLWEYVAVVLAAPSFDHRGAVSTVPTGTLCAQFVGHDSHEWESETRIRWRTTQRTGRDNVYYVRYASVFTSEKSWTDC
ncbi:hypothetical protein BC629DRAFT_160160 [Irpex lacteus]|nr:hypothetical protein BC629DRAFT_160160 [Irpex lacteus]